MVIKCNVKIVSFKFKSIAYTIHTVETLNNASDYRTNRVKAKSITPVSP